MKTPLKQYVFNDPIYGFIRINDSLILDLIETPYFQRLRRIAQVGLTSLVYPGAHHTRFHHALGGVHLMQQAIYVLRSKGVAINKKEERGLQIAILLHDIGHGPFSHAMEKTIIKGISHEALSLKFMELLNIQFKGKLDLAITIFKGESPRYFFNQLVSSQLDVDRLDYLKRDSFYTGVAEGNINSERLISMFFVVADQLVLEEKGLYSVEKYLMARRFMYWQVYLHKNGIAAEAILIKIFERAKYLLQKGNALNASASLLFFLKHEISPNNISEKVMDQFSKLDDIDILSAIKTWVTHKDFVLSKLCTIILHRKLLKVKIKNIPITPKNLEKKRAIVIENYKLNTFDASFFVFTGSLSNLAYNKDFSPILLVSKGHKTTDLSMRIAPSFLETLSKNIEKYYICYPKKGF